MTGALRRSSTRGARRRRGGAYLLVLVVAAIIALLGVTTAHIARANLATASQRTSVGDAELLAWSAMEHALGWIEDATTAADAVGQDWRESSGTSVVSSVYGFGTGTFAWTLADETDGDLGDDVLDPVVVQATGIAGDAVHRLAVRLEPRPGTDGLDCLASGLHVNGNATIGSGLYFGDGLFTVNGDLATSGADVHLDVEATGAISGGTYHGSTTPGAAVRSMPDASSVFDYYLARGTWIDIDDIEHIGSNDSHGDLQDMVLSPTSNPLGPANPEGIYIVDCKGRHLKIKNSRIVGTIVVVNPDPLKPTKIEHWINWQPAFPNYPALLVDGGLIFKLKKGSLSEAVRLTNFNPPGTPYQGTSDSDITDTFPNVAAGLFYAAGPITIEENTGDPGMQRIEGVIVADGPLSTINNPEMLIMHADTWLLDPPPGFAVPNGPLRVVPGSWERRVD